MIHIIAGVKKTLELRWENRITTESSYPEIER